MQILSRCSYQSSPGGKIGADRSPCSRIFHGDIPRIASHGAVIVFLLLPNGKEEIKSIQMVQVEFKQKYNC